MRVICLFAVSLIFLLGLRVLAAGAIGQSEKRSRPAISPSELLAFNIPVLPNRASQFDAKVYYSKNCQKCHGADGVGTEGRKTFAETPNFTSKAWQKKRSDVQLEISIQEGKGAGMPPFSEKLSEDEVKNLRKIVRDFADEH